MKFAPKTKSVLLLLALFCVGIGTGFFLNEQIIRWRIARFERVADIPARITQNLAERLALDAGQQKDVYDIFAWADGRFKDHRDREKAEREAIREEIDQRVMAVLDETQRAKFQTLREEQAQRPRRVVTLR